MSVSEYHVTIASEWQDWCEKCLPPLLPELNPLIPILRDAFYGGAITVMALRSFGRTDNQIMDELKAKLEERGSRA